MSKFILKLCILKKIQLSKTCDSQNVQFCLDAAYFNLNKHSKSIYFQAESDKYLNLSLTSHNASLCMCTLFSSKFTQTHNKKVLVRMMCESKLISYICLKFT